MADKGNDCSFKALCGVRDMETRKEEVRVVQMRGGKGIDQKSQWEGRIDLGD